MIRIIPAAALTALLAACAATPETPPAAMIPAASTPPAARSEPGRPPVEGVDWRLADAAAIQRVPSLRFDLASRRVSGSGGCNRLNGPYTLQGATLRIGPLASTRMACPDPAAGAMETRFLAALQATTAYRVEGGFLILLDTAGTSLLRLEPAG